MEEQSFEDDYKTDPVTGKKQKKGLLSRLSSKNKLSRQDMDEIFLGDDW